MSSDLHRSVTLRHDGTEAGCLAHSLGGMVGPFSQRDGRPRVWTLDKNNWLGRERNWVYSRGRVNRAVNAGQTHPLEATS